MNSFELLEEIRRILEKEYKNETGRVIDLHNLSIAYADSKVKIAFTEYLNSGNKYYRS